MARRLEEFWLWVESGLCLIKPRAGAKVEALVLNEHQKQIWRAMYRQALAGESIRIIVLKARRLGCSTFCQALGYFLCKCVPHWRVVVIAHEADSTREIFGISKRMLDHDPEPVESLKAGNRKEIGFHHDSQFVAMTAGGRFPGSGSAINFLHISELAKWPNDMVSVADQLSSIMQAVPADAQSIVVIESTANRRDASGEYESRFRLAQSGQSGYIAVFTGWNEEQTYRARVKGSLEYTEYENAAIASHGLDDEQIVWRRRKIQDDYAGSEVLFAQEYPLVPDEAFQVAEGKIFPILKRERHDRRLSFDQLAPDLYRGVDWGGRHAFVAVWVAHRDGQPGFSIDAEACPNIWQCFSSWSRDEKGKPQEKWKDGVDAVRYVVMQFNLTGWVHVYREMYIPNSAHRGLSELDLAQMVLKQSGREPVISTVADRSRPNSIILFTQQGVPTCAMQTPGTSVAGEIEDGIAVLVALMQGNVPFEPPKPAETRLQQALRQMEQRGALNFGEQDVDLVLAVRDYRAGSGKSPHPFLGACW